MLIYQNWTSNAVAKCLLKWSKQDILIAGCLSNCLLTAGYTKCVNNTNFEEKEEVVDDCVGRY